MEEGVAVHSVGILEEQSANTYVTAKVDGIARSTAGASMCPGRGRSIHGITCMLYETTANFRFATAQVRSALAVVNDAGTIKLWGG